MAVLGMRLSLFLLLLLARSPVHCSALFVFNSTVDIDGTLRSNASLSVPLEIGSGALFSERSEMYTWTGINERYANGDFVTAELTWALPNSTTPGAICDATPEDIAATKGKIVLQVNEAASPALRVRIVVSTSATSAGRNPEYEFQLESYLPIPLSAQRC